MADLINNIEIAALAGISRNKTYGFSNCQHLGFPLHAAIVPCKGGYQRLWNRNEVLEFIARVDMKKEKITGEIVLKGKRELHKLLTGLRKKERAPAAEKQYQRPYVKDNFNSRAVQFITRPRAALCE
jgi:hypothetical protein